MARAATPAPALAPRTATVMSAQTSPGIARMTLSKRRVLVTSAFGAVVFEAAAASGMPIRDAMIVERTAIWNVSQSDGRICGSMEKSGGQKRERKRPRFAA